VGETVDPTCGSSVSWHRSPDGVTVGAGHKSVAVIGAGQLGSRYLQGLAGCMAPLEIHVQDPDSRALRVAELRWKEVLPPERHRIMFHQNSSMIPSDIEVAVVSTTARVRPAVMEEFITGHEVRYWIIEKVVAQGLLDLERVVGATDGAEGAWVNTWPRVTPWYHLLRDLSADQSPWRFEAVGRSWGMGCNAVHLLDFCAWWTSQKLIVVDAEGLDSVWWPAKRQGFYEPSGRLVAHYEDDSSLTLRATPPTVVEGSRSPAGLDDLDHLLIESEGDRWEIDSPFSEDGGRALGVGGRILNGRIEYQSERAGGIIEGVVADGRCGLPTLAESVELHRVYLGTMIKHWNAVTVQDVDHVPIT